MEVEEGMMPILMDGCTHHKTLLFGNIAIHINYHRQFQKIKTIEFPFSREASIESQFGLLCS